MKTYRILRPAVAMIELIFAIVIMGLVMMTAPMLLNTASKSGFVAIQQEGINEASTQANIMLGYAWDENDTNVSNSTVLYVSNGDDDLNATISPEPGNPLVLPNRRTGTPASSHRLYISINGSRFNASAIGADGAAEEIDDIDDFDGVATTLVQEEDAGTSDYIEKDTIQIARTVGYMADAPTSGNYADPGGDKRLDFAPAFADTAGTTNIKRIQVTLTSSSGIDELDKTIVLHAFSCNIGTYTLEER